MFHEMWAAGVPIHSDLYRDAGLIKAAGKLFAAFLPLPGPSHTYVLVVLV